MTYADLIEKFDAVVQDLSFDINFGFGTASEFAHRQNWSMPSVWLEPPKPSWVFTEESQQLTEVFVCTVNIMFRDKVSKQKPKRNEAYSIDNDDTALNLDSAFNVSKELILKLQDNNDDIVIKSTTSPTPFVNKTHMNVTGFIMDITIGNENAYADTYCDC